MEKTVINDTKKILDVSNSMLNDSTFKTCMLERVSFTDVNMAGTNFTDVNMTGTKIIDANLSDLEIENAQLGGAWIHNIGVAPEGHPFHKPGVVQRPLKFDDCYLGKSTITNCNLTGVAITDCNLDGMTINGILVEELLKVYNKK